MERTPIVFKESNQAIEVSKADFRAETEQDEKRPIVVESTIDKSPADVDGDISEN